MSKKTIINIVQISVILIYVGLVAFFLAFFKMNENAYNALLYSTMGFGLINAILALVRVINDILMKRLTGAIHASTVFIPTVFHYALKYFGHYMEYRVLYFTLFLGILVVTVVILTIINQKLAPQKPVMTKEKR